MKFDELVQKLLEGTSPLRRLYHYTGLDKAADIVTQNKFELTFAKGADASKNIGYKRNFYLSCSTIARGRYATGSGGKFYDETYHCIIELDASKVSDNYRIIPVDYWYYPGRPYSLEDNMDESEERIVSRDNKIPNAKKYIIAVHIYVPPDKEKPNEDDIYRKLYKTNQINRIAQSGVDYYIYDNIKYFTILHREKAHKLEGEHQYELEPTFSRPEYEARMDKQITDVVNWLTDPDAPIDEKAKDRLERHWNWQDSYSTVNSDLHDARSNKRPARRAAILKLSEYQRKTKKSLEDIVKDAYYRNRERY